MTTATLQRAVEPAAKAKRPRIDEIRSGAKFLREEACRQRNYAEGDRICQAERL